MNTESKKVDTERRILLRRPKTDVIDELIRLREAYELLKKDFSEYVSDHAIETNFQDNDTIVEKSLIGAARLIRAIRFQRRFMRGY